MINSNAILWAVPFYLFMIALELIFSLYKNKKLYDLSEAISNISCGIVQQVGDAVLNLLVIPIYIYFYETLSIVQLDSSLSTFVFLFLYKDFVYYWSHRLTHTTSLWSIHLVHHQPKYYNYSVGLRMPLLHYIIDFIPMIFAAILGFDVESFILVSVFFASIQLFSHTKFIKKEIPILSWFFVTPSFHRVHHAKNKIYLNKNFSAVICIWDKLFGTYQKELEAQPVEFGVLKENEYTLNPLMANFVYWSQKPIRTLNKKSFITNSLLLMIPAVIFIAFAKNVSLFASITISIVLLYLYSKNGLRNWFKSNL